MSELTPDDGQPSVVLAEGYVSAIRDDTDMERPLNVGDVVALADSHEALRAALATAEAERDAAMESREWWRTARSDAISLDLKALVERVGVLEAALRELLDALWDRDKWIATHGNCGKAFAAARAVLAVPEGDAE